MFNKSRIIISSFIIAGALVSTAHATDTQVLQMELEQLIKDCNVISFKSGYAALEAEFKTAEEKAKSLASFECIAQETKKRKVADFDKILSRGAIKSYWPFTKFLAQGLCAGILGFAGIGSITCYFWAATDAGDTAYLKMAVPSLIIAVPFVYYAEHNYAKALCVDPTIKADITALNEIVAFINQAKNK